VIIRQGITLPEPLKHGIFNLMTPARILTVEDNMDNYEFVHLVLKCAGYYEGISQTGRADPFGKHE